jgi:hypothetical protein
MDCEKEISFRIEKIKTIFQTAKDISSTEKDLKQLIDHLETTELEFRSIAYEGASMAIALKDFEKDDTLNTWHTFNEKASDHAAQTHAGLGWAIAQQNSSPLPFLESLAPLLRFRVLDGCGYYDGIFRQRQSIKAQKFPEELTDTMLKAYDQGIGRSLWYASKGDVKKLEELISGFAPIRHSSLWIGIGVACAYVGGCDESLLNTLLLSSQTYQAQLATGAALAARARVQANAITKDIELACRIWCHSSVQEAMLFTVGAEPDSSVNANDCYFLWLSQIEKKLLLSHSSK